MGLSLDLNATVDGLPGINSPNQNACEVHQDSPVGSAAQELNSLVRADDCESPAAISTSKVDLNSHRLGPICVICVSPQAPVFTDNDGVAFCFFILIA